MEKKLGNKCCTKTPRKAENKDASLFLGEGDGGW